MFRKLFCLCIIGLSLNQSTVNQTMFKIVANSDQKEDIKEMYNYKNDLIQDYSKMITGVDEERVIEDLLILYPEMTYENGELCLILGKGEGKGVSGELKQNYCEVKIKPKSWLGELFNGT